MSKFCLVTQRIGAFVGDSPDDDDRKPDHKSVNGSVTFTPKLRDGDAVLVTDEDGVRTVSVVPIVGQIVDGVLSHEGEPGVYLFAGGENANPSKLVYTVTYSGLTVGQRSVMLRGTSLEAIPGGEIDLSGLIPVAGSTGQGVARGEPGKDAPHLLVTGETVDEEGNTVVSFSDGASVTVSKGDKGDPGPTGALDLTDESIKAAIDRDVIPAIEGARDDALVQVEGAVAELSYLSTVTATNLLGNGFITQPAWAATPGSVLSLGGGSGVATSSGTTSPLGMRRTDPITVQSGDVLWVDTRMRARNFQAAAYKIQVTDGTTEISSEVVTPPHLSWVNHTGTIVVPESLADKPLTVSVVAESSEIVTGSIVEVYRIAVLNLTDMYGSGNEPGHSEIWNLVQALALPGMRVDGRVENFHRDPVVVTKKALPDLVADALPDITDGMVETALVGKLPAKEDWHPSKPGVVLRFDDGYTNNLTLAAPVLKKHGFRGYLAMCTRWQGERPGGVIMQPEQVQQLATKYGWEIGSHTSEHMDAIGHPDFVRGLDESLADLASWEGVGYPDTFTYPNGSRTRQTDREVYLRFAKCQLTSSPEVSPTPHDAPTFFTGWAVASGTATEGTKALQVERMKTYVRESMRRGHVAVLGFHGIELTAPTVVDYNLDLATFTHIIEWLAAEGIPVILPRDMPPHNLVADPGFNEFQVWPWGTGAAHPWGVSPYAHADRWQRVTTGQYSGLAAMRITGTTAKTSTFSQGVAVRPGETYRIHALAKAAATSGAITIEISPRDLTGDAVGTTQLISTVTAGSWTDHTGEITIPDGATTVNVIVRATDFIGEAWVDHLALIPSWLYDPLAI